MPDKINMPANEGLDYSYDQEYTLTLQGFDVKITLSPLGNEYLHVVIVEQGEQVFEEDLPQPLTQEGEIEELVLQNVAQMAIDLLEAERGTLGQGAGALEMAANLNKKSCWVGIDERHEEWFMNLKGTPYENMAFDLLTKYYELENKTEDFEDQSREICKQIHNIRKEIQRLDLQRLKNSDANTKVIIIEGSKKAFLGDSEQYQDLLDKFFGCPLESELAKNLNKLIELESRQKEINKSSEDSWEEKRKLEEQMEGLALESLQVNVIKKIPTSGLEAFPALGNELAELMSGVSLDEPEKPGLQPPQQSPFVMGAAKEEEDKEENPDKTQIIKEYEPVEDRVLELGPKPDKDHLFNENSEEMKFEVGDRVELTKKLEVPHAGDGHVLEYSKGEKGTIGVLFDGNFFTVYFDSGAICRVLKDFLKKI